MSRLGTLLRRVLAWLNTPTAPASAEPLPGARDWADLPPHHPLCDCAPR